jgi:hypothetical protein
MSYYKFKKISKLLKKECYTRQFFKKKSKFFFRVAQIADIFAAQFNPF